MTIRSPQIRRPRTGTGYRKLYLCLPVLSVLLLRGCIGAPEASEDAIGRIAPAQVIGSAPPAVARTPSVVMLEAEGATDQAMPRDTALMDQIDITFTPELLVVHVGQIVAFQNSEDVPHNVRAQNTETAETLFNVETGVGETYHHGFAIPGEYSILCDIHPGMSATVLVVATPYVAIAEPDGSFSFSEIPAGSYTLRVWSADTTRRVERSVAIDGTMGQVILEGARSVGEA